MDRYLSLCRNLHCHLTDHRKTRRRPSRVLPSRSLACWDWRWFPAITSSPFTWTTQSPTPERRTNQGPSFDDDASKISRHLIRVWIEGIGIECRPRETLLYTTRIWRGMHFDTRSADNADAQLKYGLEETSWQMREFRTRFNEAYIKLVNNEIIEHNLHYR